VAKLACGGHTTDRLSILYLEHYDNSISKSMKQVLVTLNKLYSRCLAITGHCVERDGFAQRLIDVLVGNKQHSRAKAAFHALTLFTNKASISPPRLVALYKSSLADDTWRSQFQEKELSVEGQLFAGLLEWISFHDIAPTAGTLITALLVKGYGSLARQGQHPNDKVPWWTLPLLQSVQTHSHDLTIYRAHIFPALFATDCVSYWHFLKFLGLEQQLGLPSSSDTIECNIELHLPADVRAALLYSALQVGKENGLIQENGMTDSPSHH